MDILINQNHNKNEIQNARIYPLASDPATGGFGAGEKGLTWFNTTDNIFKYWNGSSVKTVVTLAELESAIEGLSWKDSVTCATTANVTIATALNSGDVIDGITLADGDRVLVKDQTSQSENGIYVVAASPARADDMSASEEFNNAVVAVDEGTTNEGTTWRQTAVDPTVETTNIIFESFGAVTPNATTTTKGKVELATAAEAQARTDSTRATTPVSLASFSVVYSADFNNTIDWAGSGPYTITVAAATHGCGASKKLTCTVYKDGTPNELVITDITVSDTGELIISANEKFAGHYIIMGIA